MTCLLFDHLSSDDGTVTSNPLTVLRLITISNFVGCKIGRSAGFSNPTRVDGGLTKSDLLLRGKVV